MLATFQSLCELLEKVEANKKGRKIIEQNTNPLNTLQAEKLILLLT